MAIVGQPTISISDHQHTNSIGNDSIISDACPAWHQLSPTAVVTRVRHVVLQYTGRQEDPHHCWARPMPVLG